MPVQTTHRFNVAEYYRMAEVGVLKPDARVALIEGEVWDCFRVTPLHASVTRRLAEFFVTPEERFIVSVRNPMRLGDYDESQPDLALLKYIPNYYKTRHPEPNDVFLLIEVSDTSLDHDRELKIPVYARAGIREVWNINLPDLTVEVYREPHFTGYASKTILRTGDKASPASFPDVTIDLSELLRK